MDSKQNIPTAKTARRPTASEHPLAPLVRALARQAARELFRAAIATDAKDEPERGQP